MTASKKETMSGLVLSELKKHGNISRAARMIGVNRRTIIRWAENDSAFRAAWERAIKEGRR